MSNIKDILEKLTKQEISIEEAENLLKVNIVKSVEDLAKLDILREVRTGIPEVIFAEKKDPKLLLEIIKSYLEENHFVIISRYKRAHRDFIIKNYNESEKYDIEINEPGRIIIIKKKNFNFVKKKGIVGIITAGTSDIPVAEEAKIIANAMGCVTISSYDIGIAGLHRIFEPLTNMIKKKVDVIIVCAGMEGTLPGVIAALVDVPVIGVPVSSGYGFGEKGKGALITMLQSCSPGLLVVNIDNGFGAGASASLIANRVKKIN